MPTATPSEPPRILVLLATHNGVLWLGEQLQSIVEQHGVHISILASDDRSTDDTVSFVMQWAARTSAKLCMLPPTDVRLGAAGNFLRLIREAPFDGFDAVALSDQDDVWQPDRLLRGITMMHSERLGGYSSDVEAFWEGGKRKILGKACAQRRHDHLFEPAGPGCTYILSPELVSGLQRELRRDPRRFDDIGYHDWLIYAYARCHGHRWVIDTHASVAYRQHAGNELGANLGAMAVPKRWRRLTSGWFRRQVLQIAGLWTCSADDLIERLSRLNVADRIWLAAHVRQLRRRPRDQFALAMMLLLGVLR